MGVVPELLVVQHVVTVAVVNGALEEEHVECVQIRRVQRKAR